MTGTACKIEFTDDSTLVYVHYDTPESENRIVD